MPLSVEKKKLVQRLRSNRLRAREGLFLVEGVRGVREFLQTTLPMSLRFSLVSHRLMEMGGGPEVRALLEEKGLLVHEVDDADLDALSDTETSQGVLVVAEEPQMTWPPAEEPGGRRFLLLDGIQDPGNVGTLIRAARAFGVHAVLALEGTADPWAAKTIRSAAGSTAHIPVARIRWADVQTWLQGTGLPLVVAEAGGLDVRGWSSPGGWALVLGNEGAGVRPEIRSVADACLAVPMADAVESLNVAMAGAILLFALTLPQTPRVTP